MTNYNDLRQKLLNLRAQQDSREMSRGALLMRGRLFTWLNQYRQQRPDPTRPLHIAAYWALANEPDLRPLLSQWSDEENIHISLPCVVGADAPLVFKPWHPEQAMKQAAFGVLEPDTTALAPDPEIVLVPTLGFTRQGDRLGYGKGYYDRTLADLTTRQHTFISLGLSWAVGDLSQSHYEPAPHDVPLDAVLTDRGWPKPAPV